MDRRRDLPNCLCSDGFDLGLPAALAVTMELEALQPQSPEWSDELQNLADAVTKYVQHVNASVPAR